MGNLDQAVVWLERSIEDRSAERANIVGPIFNELRSDPRFDRLRPLLGS